MTDEKGIPQVEDIECESLPCFKRNNYFYGKLLTVDDFQVEQQYFVNKLRLINRLIHGAGVVCGLKVLMRGNEAANLGDDQIRITEGVAIDFCGREIIVPNNVDIELEDELRKKHLEDKDVNEIYVWIRYDFCGDEKVPKVLEASSCQEECCYSKIKESYRIEADPNLPEPHRIPEGDICAEWDKFIKNPREYDFFLKKCLDTFENEVIVLAKVRLGHRKDGSIFVSDVDNSVNVVNQRKLVYNNDRLYSLIECLRKKIEDLKKKTDLPQIIDIGWEHDYQCKSIAELMKIISNGFWIQFSKPMKQTTINSRTLGLTLEVTSREGKQLERIRISKNEMPAIIQFPEEFPGKLIQKGQMVKFWLNPFAFPDLTLVNRIRLRLIIQLKGDFVCSSDEKESKCLDGNHLKGKRPTGDGSEGGLFESWVNGPVETAARILFVTSNSVGIGQKALVGFWVDPFPPTFDDRFSNIRFKIKKPDGASDDQNPTSVMPLGLGYLLYSPDSIGTYKIQLDYPGEKFSSTGDYYAPCSSSVVDLVVQQAAVVVARSELYASPGLMVALKFEGTSESELLKKMKTAGIKSVEDLAEFDSAKIAEKLDVSNNIALELSACAKSVKDLERIEGIDKNMVSGLMAAGTMSAKALAESKPKDIKNVLGITIDEAKDLRKKAALIR